MPAPWTPERRQRQAAAIQKWRPWESSTGPKSAEGKAKTARNAYKGGGWRKSRDFIKAVNAVLREQMSAL
jgi:hypothetical protein